MSEVRPFKIHQILCLTYIWGVESGFDVCVALVGLYDEFTARVAREVEVFEALERRLQTHWHNALTALLRGGPVATC